MFTRDLALWLRRRGHAVTIFATTFGDMADELRYASIACVTDVADMAGRPDVIIGNTHHETVRALLHFHDVPVLTICHDRSADHGRPARFAQVVCHVAVDENCAERLVHEFGIPRERIELIQNGVDLSRFLPRPALPVRPRSALVFSNYASHDAQLEEVRAACTQRGLTLDVIGSGSGNHMTDPAAALGRYDVVFAKGRCATEALVTGNAVVVLDPSMGMGEMVTAGEVAHARRWNFGRALMVRPITRDNVGAELDRYDAQDAGAAAAWGRAKGGLDVTLGALETWALRLSQQYPTVEVPSDQRAREMAHYMDDWIRRGSPTAAHLAMAALQQQLALLHQALNDRQRAHQVELDARQAQVQGHADRATAQAELAEQLRATEAACSARLADAEQQSRQARAELAGLQAQLREVHASRSWRVTAPLRRISTFLLSRSQRA
ncbi:glycosyltransferase family 4 protein [Variovorax ginsengisoli]|uniref:Glycosyltransferase family 4 protein n=1 Tax=Variovorax ginsengisoli TaxID=363844 RepID=A0ABT8S233_9BURK|nr:glycosyltransferase family 4 protein [Variovorax ginsengisoli]MDN8613094.1 glycosyltransferase family 4 protein [Variovorax ginsengisoli]MDO1532264.1 glycosyltransferase family 4 protein [Variovorax ginsengisoli]